MYRLVDTEIWDDAWYSDLAPEAKFLFLWFLTNRRTNSVGAYEITLRQVAFETGLKSDTSERLLKGLHPKVQWWPEHSIVWVMNFYGRQYNGEKIEINARRIVASLPDEVRVAVCIRYPALKEGGDTPSIPHPNPMDKQDSNVTVLNTTERDVPLAGSGQRYSGPFQEFWTAYGATNGPKKPAYTAWERLSKADRAAALAALPAWHASVKWREGFKPYPQRYLNQRFWEGDPAAGAVSPNGVVPHQQTAEEIAEFKAWMKENQPA